MGGMKWMARTIRAGATGEKYDFPVPLAAKPKGRRMQKCTPRKQDENEHRAEKRLARLLNCNFKHNDALLTLTWDEDHVAELGNPADANAARSIAEKAADNFLARVKYHLRRARKTLGVYILVVSDMNGDTGELVRPHVHLVVKGSAVRMEDGKLYAGASDLEALWGRGSINLRALHDQPDLTPVAVYLMRQVRRQPDKAKYRAARGMKKPVIVDEEIVSGRRELRAPKGAKIVYRSAYEPGKPQYIRYVMPERDKTAKGRRRE